MSAMGAKETKTDSSMDVKEAVALIDDADAKIKEAEKSLEALNKEKTQLQALVDQIVPFNNLGYDVQMCIRDSVYSGKTASYFYREGCADKRN